jgi:hypothetical protein
MNLLGQTGFWINALATAASLVSFILAIHLLLKDRKKANKTLAWRYVGLFVLCSAVLLSSGYFYAKRFTTLKQSGDFGNAAASVMEIYYPVPYKTSPHLLVRLKDPGNSGGSVRVIEQRPDGFKVDAGFGFVEFWEWQAEGIPIDK